MITFEVLPSTDLHGPYIVHRLISDRGEVKREKIVLLRGFRDKTSAVVVSVRKLR